MALKKIGALWARNGKNQKSFFAGKVDGDIKKGSKIMLFKNEGKKSDKHPDFSISLVQDDTQSA